MALAFYRKYRPQNFEELVGQDPVQSTLLEALKQKRLSHAYLFSGPRGTGKTSTARLIARAIQCESPLENGQACGVCAICQMSAKGDLVDLIEIDAASNRGIDEIRDLKDKIRFAPSYAKSKVYIIDEVHMLTKEAFNALLKSLEEPPSHVTFILATTELHKIPETILSRCQRYEFKRIASSDLVRQLRTIVTAEGLEAEDRALELLAKHAEGGMRDAITLLEQLSGQAITEALVREKLGLGSLASAQDLYGALGSADAPKALAIIENLHQQGLNLAQFTGQFLGLLREKLHEAVAERKEQVIPKLLEWIELFDTAWIKLKSASIPTLPLEIAVVRATHQNTVVSAPKAANLPAPSTAAPQMAPQTDALRLQLPAALAKISNPGLRNALQTAQISSVDGADITFSFSSQFHYDLAHKADALIEFENALKDLLKQDVHLHFKMCAEPKTDLGWETVEEPL